jgi:hypothetical protein
MTHDICNATLSKHNEFQCYIQTIFQTFYQHSLGDHSYMPLAKIANVIIAPKLITKDLFFSLFFHHQDASMAMKTITILMPFISLPIL